MPSQYIPASCTDPFTARPVDEPYVSLKISASALRRLLGGRTLQVEELRALDHRGQRLIHQALLEALTGNSRKHLQL